MSLKRYTSIFFAFLLIWTAPVHAQINLDLLENSPTPTPLPEGQNYILEIEQIDLSKQTEIKPTLTSSQKKMFDQNGFVVIQAQGVSGLTIEKTQLTFESFMDGKAQSKSTQVKLDEHATSSGFQLLMNLKESLSSGDRVVAPTNCSETIPCTVTRAVGWDDMNAGWGYSLDGETYRPVPTNNTTIERQGVSSRSRPYMMTWRVQPENKLDGIYSARVQLIVLPF